MTSDTDKKVNGADNMKTTTASEEDPCIEENVDNKKTSFRDRTEEKLRQKSGLSRKGLLIAGAILLLLFVLLIVVISLGAAWPHIPHHQQYPVCHDAACLEAAAQIRANMNDSYTPCSDIWKWSCGGWLQRNPLPPDRSLWNLREQLRFQEAVRIRDLITTLPLPLHTATIHWKLKNFYESCMEVENVDADGVGPLLQIIRELGGWHVIRNWNVHSWDYRRVLEKLHSVHGATPFFEISVEPNPRVLNSNSIRIAPAGLGLPDRSFYYKDPDDKVVVAYKRLLMDVVTLLSATTNEAQRFSTDIFHFEKRIAEITPESMFFRNPVNTYNLISISELKITAASLPLREILVAMFPMAEITDEIDIIVSSPDYLTAISSIVSSTDRSALNNYVIWTLVRRYLPYLPSEYNAEYQHYLSELKGIQKPLKRWEYCVDIIKKYMGLAVEIMLENKNPIKVDAVESVNDIFRSIQSAALNSIKTNNFQREIRNHLLQKVLSLKVQVGFPENVTGNDFIEQYYSKLYILKSNLFRNMYNAISFLREKQQEQYSHPKSEDRILPYTTGEKMKVGYSPSANNVIIPRFLLKDPYYDPKYPLSVTYGRLGIDIASAIVTSILPFQSSWTKDSSLLSPYHIAVNQSESAVNSTRECIAKFLTRNNFSKDVAISTSLSVLKHLASVKLAHTALTSVVENMEHTHQPALEMFEDSALFFLTYAQAQCIALSDKQLHLENVVNFNVDDGTLLRVTWENYLDFPEAFDCRTNNNAMCSAIL